MANTQESLEAKYIRLYEFTRSVLLSTKLPSEFEDNYEIKLAKETIESFKN